MILDTIDEVGPHIANRAGPAVDPATPNKGVVDATIRDFWRGARSFRGPRDPVYPDYRQSSMASIIDLVVLRLKDTGSICRQVGNYVTDGEIVPLDTEFAPIFKRHNLQLRNCIFWHLGHGLHTRRRFSGRYEVVL